ncbi:MAG: PKD domain-containing protein [Ferruginibacter sp.]
MRFGRFAMFILWAFCFGFPLSSFAQCPPNIDFEQGDFSGWTCYTGYVSAASGQNVISLTPSGPVPNRHTMYSPGAGFDPFGNFPVNCPNGSGHSIKLGNDLGGGEAEGISYEFTIPASENLYSLIYHYAVVFQDPNHQFFQQPRMEIEITNVTDNTVITCSSFTFYPYGSPLPGFTEIAGGESPIWFKPWSAVSINLDGNAGKKIRLFFKTADCTFRKHFGYAYIDVNSECSGTFVGATYCADDTAIHITAPFGYQNYTWFNNNFTQVLGTQQVLTLSPPPATGTTVAVEVVPYNGYGCLDTLYARLIDTLTVTANAGPDRLSCNHNAVQIGAPPKPGLVYHWNPATGLNDPGISNPMASPDVTTTYVITTNHDGGGCIVTDTVIVKAAALNNALQLLGKDRYCIGSGDSAVLKVQAADSIQWFRNGIAIPAAHDSLYHVTQSGLYYAQLFSFTGCTLSTTQQQIDIASVPVAAFTVNNPVQCMVNNKFNFTNSSTNALGAMEYHWIFGDGTEAFTKNSAHTYNRPGIFTVRLTVTSNTICTDIHEMTVTVYPNAFADFILKPVCTGLPSQVINTTADTVGSPISYLWNFGNGQTSTLRNPPPQIYPVAGNYIVSLAVSTVQCPAPPVTLSRLLVVDKPRTGITYPLEYAVIDYPLTLHARNFGETVLWEPAINLDEATSYTPVFVGRDEQLYTIRIKTVSGCLTVDTQLVKTVKNVEIYVPNAFTPNNDGTNDFLRPILRGITEIHFFRVFNRWGQLMFEMRSDKPGWDGSFKGVAQESQTVVWMLEGVGVDGKIYSKKGTSILLR